MALSNQNTFLWCKSQFEAALRMFRLGCGELDYPQFGDERFEAAIMGKILSIQFRIANEELVHLYLLALDRKTHDEKSDLKKPAHKVGDILLEYFQGEAQAILYLEKVSVRALVRLTNEQRQLILQDKVQDDPFIRGPDFKWKDEMWWYIYEMCQSFDFYAPLGDAGPMRGTKRARDLEEELSDPPCALGFGVKRVRRITYHL
jgi:hypothetical protein